MNYRTVSALFDDHADAIDAQAKLRNIGIPESSITITSSTDAREKGFWESLGDMFFPENDREAYAEGLSRGGTLVTVTGLDDTNFDLAADILDEEGSIDLDERERTWRTEGWKSTGYGTTVDATTPSSTTETVIPVVEERLVVGKRDVGGSRTRVRSYVVDKPVEEGVTLREQHVEVERRAADRPATEADIRAQEQVVEGVDSEEEVVLGKEKRVVEEVVVRQEQGTHTERVADTVRETKVEVDKDKNE